MRVFSKIILIISAIAYLGFGLWALIAPATLVAPVSLNIVDGNGLTEITTMYGGVDSAIGLFFALAAYNKKFTHHGLLFGLFNYGGLTFGRSLGILLYQPTSLTLFVSLLFIEALFFVFFIIAWRGNHPSIG